MRTLTGLCLSALLLCLAPAYAQTPAPSGIRVCVDTDAYPTKMASPDSNAIPDTARLMGRSKGTVVILVSVDSKGTVTNTSVAQTDSLFLNAAAIEAARKSVYAPATHGCVPGAGQYRFVAVFGGLDSGATKTTGASSKSNSSSNNRSSAYSKGDAQQSCTPGSAYLKSAQPVLPATPLTQPGSAMIHVIVDRKGALKSATPVKSDLPPAYADAALAMVKGGTFSPKIGDDCQPADDEEDVSIGFHP
jgi:TonB family protein